MAKQPSEATLSLHQLRRRLRGNEPPAPEPAPVAPPAEVAVAEPEPPAPPKPRKNLSGFIPRPRDIAARTPLPQELPSAAAILNDEVLQLRAQNAELRNLVEQAILQEGEFDRQSKSWTARENDLLALITEASVRVHTLEEQVNLLKSGAGEAGDLIVKLQERDESARVMTEQMRQMDQHLQYLQETGQEANEAVIQERDTTIETLNSRIAELEKQIADTPPPAPTDEELARMADELERERCQVAQIRKQLEEDQITHSEDISDFERQLREMEVQMSKERAEMARQRTELQRLQSEVQAEMESVQRGDGVLRDRLAQIQKRPEAADGQQSGTAKRDKDTGFMNRLFGKK